MSQTVKPDTEKYTVRIIARISPALRERLNRVVTTARLGETSDHIRLALEEYIERKETHTTH